MIDIQLLEKLNASTAQERLEALEAAVAGAKFPKANPA